MNLSSADTKPETTAIGTHSFIVNPKKILINGIIEPPPAIPPALASIVMINRIIPPVS